MEKNKKQLLISYLKKKAGTDIRRTEIIEKTGISPSRLSELIWEIRNEGYQVSTPPRSGIVRMEKTEQLENSLKAKDIRQWLILFALSASIKPTYKELVFTVLSLVDSYENSAAEAPYSDMGMLNYYAQENPGLRVDIDAYLPLPTFRKDLRELCKNGYVIQNRENRNGKMHIVYSLSEKAPAVLFKSSIEIEDFLVFYDNFKDSLSDSAPVHSVYKKASALYGWENTDSMVHAYGKSKRIPAAQLEAFRIFLASPYQTKELLISYLADGQTFTFRISAGLVFFSTETGCFYLLCRDNERNRVVQLRLDRIRGITGTDNSSDYYRDPFIMKAFKEMFSSSYTERLVHVKVLFEDFGNILQRIQALLDMRPESASLKKMDSPPEGLPHTYVYEDDIRGIGSFARYLRSFGSSALVAEPEELKELMIQSNQKLFENYGGKLDE